MNNAGAFLQILLGSREKLDADNQRLVADRIKNTATKLGDNFRKIVEDNLPVFYLINVEIIIDEMLKELHPSNSQEKIAGYLNSLTITRNEGTSIQEQNVFFSELKHKNFGFLEEYTLVYNYILNNKNNLITKTLNKLNTTITKSTKIVDISNKITVLSNEVVKALAGLAIDIADTTAENKLRIIGAKLSQTFKAIGVCKISDPQTIISNFNSSTSLFVTLPSFSSITDNVHNVITQSLISQLYNEYSIQINVNSGKFLAGNFAAAGHTGLKSGSKIIGINTPLIQMASLILFNNSIDAPGLLDDFAVNTGHSNWNLEVNADYADPNKLGLSLGISYLQTMPSVINSGSLSTSELANIDAALKAKLNKSYRDLAKEFKTAIVNNFEFVFKGLRLSPTLKETVENYIVSAMTNKKYKGSNSKATSSKIGTDSLIQVKGKDQKISPGMSNKNKGSSSSATTVVDGNQQINLLNLQNLINAKLTDQIKQNMGTGNSKNILNLRTGRFAESVKVERLSESRQGMITAFYTYMRNPYATFSTGGRQEYPRTRDPKLLISKSIREIAETKVQNRLRAVLV
jgi:hypothetical protein